MHAFAYTGIHHVVVSYRFTQLKITRIAHRTVLGVTHSAYLSNVTHRPEETRDTWHQKKKGAKHSRPKENHKSQPKLSNIARNDTHKNTLLLWLSLGTRAG